MSQTEPELDPAELARRLEAFVASERARPKAPPMDERQAMRAFNETRYDLSLGTAIALWLTLGLFGAHRFYLRARLTGALLALTGVVAVADLALPDVQLTPLGGWLAFLWINLWLADGAQLRSLHQKSARASLSEAADAAFA